VGAALVIPASKSSWTFFQILQRHALLAGLVAIYLLTANALTYKFGVPMHVTEAGIAFLAFLGDVPSMIVFVLLWRLLDLTYVRRDPDRYGTIKAEVMAFLSDRNRMISGALVTFLMAGTMVAFGQLKHLIPVLNPYVWDTFFMEADRALHFGMYPHELFEGLYDWPHVITFFTGIYNFWMFMMYFVLFGAAFMQPSNPARMQFLVAFLLTWAIGGNVLATAFSSAGPVFVERLGLGDSYSSLTGVLQTLAEAGGLTVVTLQDLLWSLHQREAPINAISAFPSMHVASSVLMAIFLTRVSRWLGLFASLFALGIMIGSVLLAWHYAVDGYVGALIAAASWKVSGWMVRLAHGPRSDPGALPVV
jgi:hypothetical protein